VIYAHEVGLTGGASGAVALARIVVGGRASNVASERVAGDFGEAAKEQVAWHSGGEGLGEAGGAVECPSFGAADQWLSMWLRLGCESTAAAQHMRPSGTSPQPAQSRRAQPLRHLRGQSLAPLCDDMFAEQDAAFLILAGYRQKLPRDPIQKTFVGDPELVGCEGGCNEHVGKVAERLRDRKRFALLIRAI
jgi:hypothetical protein